MDSYPYDFRELLYPAIEAVFIEIAKMPERDWKPVFDHSVNHLWDLIYEAYE